MTNPFNKIAKNSEDTKNKSQKEAFSQEAEVSTKTCKQCGAPRPQHTNLTTCSYCGYHFMTINHIIKPDA